MVISRYSKRFRGKAKPLLLDVAVVSVHQSGQPTMDSIVSNPGRSGQVSFNIRNFYDRLEPGNGKNKYVCPVCGGRNLEIKPNCGTYHCFTSSFHSFKKSSNLGCSSILPPSPLLTTINRGLSALTFEAIGGAA